MTVTVNSFRQAFPAFADDDAYPDGMVKFWLDVGLAQHDAGRWGALLDAGVQLYVAHNCVLESQSMKAADFGGDPGQAKGAITSSSVGGVSYSRDVGSSLDPAAGNWNLTTYGTRWKAMQKMMGAGPVQIGVPTGWDAQPGAWPGPFPTGYGG